MGERTLYQAGRPKIESPLSINRNARTKLDMTSEIFFLTWGVTAAGLCRWVRATAMGQGEPASIGGLPALRGRPLAHFRVVGEAIERGLAFGAGRQMLGDRSAGVFGQTAGQELF